MLGRGSGGTAKIDQRFGDQIAVAGFLSELQFAESGAASA